MACTSLPLLPEQFQAGFKSRQRPARKFHIPKGAECRSNARRSTSISVVAMAALRTLRSPAETGKFMPRQPWHEGQGGKSEKYRTSYGVRKSTSERAALPTVKMVWQNLCSSPSRSSSTSRAGGFTAAADVASAARAATAQAQTTGYEYLATSHAVPQHCLSFAGVA